MSKFNTDYHLEEEREHGVSINPIAFLVVQSNVVKLLPVDHTNTFDKILDYVPDLMEKLNCMMNKCLQNKKDLGEKIINNMKKQCENKPNADCEDKSEIKVEEKVSVNEEIKENEQE